ncbi:D-arginine dehydrogenase [Dongia mobilis]|uniref:D-arginine dehydrogenase n=1 Tax=Dongia mobilis TaxID=578943 RepID=A0A4R6WSK7_9PROT|nr:FAD-binding oxidoreductase [Dongia mobilis]TDQ84595.1 D-arginine dehydrogenase [Dongia mobilis]
MSVRDSDFLVIGAGVSGAAAAAELAADGKVTMVEMEERPGYHSSGRSAALFTPNYGPPLVRAIVASGTAFLRTPPSGFASEPLLSPRQAVTFVGAGDEALIDQFMAEAAPETPVEEISPQQACDLAPLLRREAVARAMLDRHVTDMDANAIHQGYLKLFKARGGTLACDQRIVGLERAAGNWLATSASGEVFGAPVLINAAGAWADEIGRMAGLLPIGLQPMRRTAIIIAGDPALAPASLPAVDDGAAESYVKPDAGRLMASLGDATPSPPCDAQPEDLDMAMIVDWLERKTHLTVRRIEHSWAGLRCFVADHQPVAGFDPGTDGFFWLAGQGGYGIMLAPGLGRITRDLICDGALGSAFTGRGITAAALGPDRCRPA